MKGEIGVAALRTKEAAVMDWYGGDSALLQSGPRKEKTPVSPETYWGNSWRGVRDLNPWPPA